MWEDGDYEWSWDMNSAMMELKSAEAHDWKEYPSIAPQSTADVDLGGDLPMLKIALLRRYANEHP